MPRELIFGPNVSIYVQTTAENFKPIDEVDARWVCDSFEKCPNENKFGRRYFFKLPSLVLLAEI